MLNDHDEYLLVEALAERLPKGGSLVVSEILVRRGELPLVHAFGPRGDRTQRIPTQRHRIVLRSGRYLVSGRLHSGHGEDPLASLRARHPMVPLTYASIEFRRGGEIVREPSGTIVVNRELVDWVRAGVPLPDGGEIPWVPTRRPHPDEARKQTGPRGPRRGLTPRAERAPSDVTPRAERAPLGAEPAPRLFATSTHRREIGSPALS